MAVQLAAMGQLEPMEATQYSAQLLALVVDVELVEVGQLVRAVLVVALEAELAVLALLVKASLVVVVITVLVAVEQVKLVKPEWMGMVETVETALHLPSQEHL